MTGQLFGLLRGRRVVVAGAEGLVFDVAAVSPPNVMMTRRLLALPCEKLIPRHGMRRDAPKLFA